MTSHTPEYPIIRPCTDADVSALTRIYQYHVLHSTGTFEIDPPSLVEMTQRRTEVLGRGLPFLVIETREGVMGFAYCNWFKPRRAYRYSAENSIYLDPQALGQGLGTRLLTALCTAATTAGIRKFIAVIGDSANAASIALHRKVGFQDVGVIASCGWKFDRWLDIVLMEKSLESGNQTGSQPAPGID
ncbi:MAG: N-acetyltransferase family protein [Betaproteobacteria bacterium]|nr:N-acetyltransferase family protein [Betaproteobacteria bacterium]